MRGLLIYLTNFVLACSLGVVFVFLEDVQEDRGLADWEVGVVVASGFAAALVAQLALAPLADRGRSAPLAIIAIVAGVIGPIAFAFGTNMAVLATARGLGGMALGLYGLLARKALLGLDTTGGGAKLGVLLSTGVGGFILGPVIGAAFERFGFAAPFLVVAGTIAAAGIPATAVILRSPIATTVVDYSDLGRLLRRPKVQAAMLVNVVVLGFIGVFDVTIDRFLTDLGASTGDVALVILTVGAPLLVFPRIAGNLAERYGAAAVMFPGLALLLPAMLGYGFAGSLLFAAACGILHGSTESFASVSAQVQVLEVTGAERAAVGSALLETAGLTSATAAAAIAPIVYGAHGSRTLYVATALIGAALGLAAVIRTRQGSDRPLAVVATPPA